MIQIDNKVISLPIIENKFYCNLKQCKGICCVEGDAGAPLEEEELEIIKKYLPIIKQYLPEIAKKELKKQGHFVTNKTGEFETPLIDKKECVYTIFENGIALCSFEKAFHDKKIKFKKPISCYLYPIRITKSNELEFLNFSSWNICNSAFKFGIEKGIPIYECVKDAIIVKYGKKFYETLKKVAIEWKKYKGN